MNDSTSGGPAAAPPSDRGDDVIIGDVLHEGWRLVAGSKGAYWLAILIMAFVFFCIAVGAALLLGSTLQVNSSAGGWLAKTCSNLIFTAINAVFSAGLMMIAVNRARGKPIRAGMVFEQFPLWWNLFLASLLSCILVAIGLVLLVLPGIYLAVSYMFVLPLIADRGLGVWEALETSRRTVSRHWFKYFFWGILSSIIVGVSGAVFLFPLIWTVPLVLNAYGVLYRNAFDSKSGGAQA